MRTICTAPVRLVLVSVVVSAALFAGPSIASAQGFGVGARLAWVTADSDANVDSVRFIGGQIRLLSKRWGLEVSLDHHSESFELLNQKVSETPIQTSLNPADGQRQGVAIPAGRPGLVPTKSGVDRRPWQRGFDHH